MKVIKYSLILFCMCTFISACGSREEEILFEQQTVESEALPAEENKEQERIYVYVCGYVHNPGVVDLPDGSRVVDALEAAGGLTPDGVETYLNLAALVSDGQKLYFPSSTEAEMMEQEANEVASGMININTADVEELSTLPGIGASRAQDIIRYRETNGEYQSIEDIMQVSGIKESLYEKIKDKIRVQ